MAALSDENVKRLAMGAIIIQEARDAVKQKTGFTCSAGIAHNKVIRVLCREKMFCLFVLHFEKMAMLSHLC